MVQTLFPLGNWTILMYFDNGIGVWDHPIGIMIELLQSHKISVL